MGRPRTEARRSGASWTDIGRSMGVSMQAAQKRFTPKGSGEGTELDPNQGFARAGVGKAAAQASITSMLAPSA